MPASSRLELQPLELFDSADNQRLYHTDTPAAESSPDVDEVVPAKLHGKLYDDADFAVEVESDWFDLEKAITKRRERVSQWQAADIFSVWIC